MQRDRCPLEDHGALDQRGGALVRGQLLDSPPDLVIAGRHRVARSTTPSRFRSRSSSVPTVACPVFFPGSDRDSHGTREGPGQRPGIRQLGSHGHVGTISPEEHPPSVHGRSLPFATDNRSGLTQPFCLIRPASVQWHTERVPQDRHGQTEPLDRRALLLGCRSVISFPSCETRDDEPGSPARAREVRSNFCTGGSRHDRSPLVLGPRDRDGSRSRRARPATAADGGSLTARGAGLRPTSSRVPSHLHLRRVPTDAVPSGPR